MKLLLGFDILQDMNWQEIGKKIVSTTGALIDTGVLVPLPGRAAERSIMPPVINEVTNNDSQNDSIPESEFMSKTE